MRYYSRLKIYKASNVTFNPETKTAYSYDWYQLVTQRNGNLVLNTYNYSTTTLKHVAKVRMLLRELGLKIDAAIEAPLGLQNLESSITLYQRRIEELKAAMARPRAQRAKNLERQSTVEFYEGQIKLVKELL